MIFSKVLTPLKTISDYNIWHPKGHPSILRKSQNLQFVSILTWSDVYGLYMYALETWYALLGQYILYGQVGSWRDLFCETDSFQKKSVYFWKSRFWGYPSFKNIQMNKRNWQLSNGGKYLSTLKAIFSFQKR